MAERKSKPPSNKILPREMAITDEEWMLDRDKSDEPKGIDPPKESVVNMNLLPRSVQQGRTQLPQALRGWDRAMATAMGQTAVADKTQYELVRYFKEKDRSWPVAWSVSWPNWELVDQTWRSGEDMHSMPKTLSVRKAPVSARRPRPARFSLV